MMMLIQFIVLIAAIYLGARLGGIAIGFTGGLGVLALALLGAEPGELPLDVISIILSVIAAIAAMQVAGGMDYLVELASKLLRSHPRFLNVLAPLITYIMTFMAGTGHTAYSTMPVIVEVAKEADIPPSRPLSLSVVSSQVAITASPISAAVVVFSGMLGEYDTGFDYVDLLMVAIPSTFIAILVTPFLTNIWDRLRKNTHLSENKHYQERLAKGLVAPPSTEHVTRELPSGAKRSVLIFLVGLIAVTAYATMISEKIALIMDPIMTRDSAIIAIMLAVAAVIVLSCRIKPADVLDASTFKSGMSAAICVLGVAWMGMTFIEANLDTISSVSQNVLSAHPWMLAVVLILASTLLYSQAATTRAIMPTALAIGVGGPAAIAAFPAVSGLFILPTYPTLLAASEMDDTGTTAIGKYVFNHPFILPGILQIGISVALGFLFVSFIS